MSSASAHKPIEPPSLGGRSSAEAERPEAPAPRPRRAAPGSDLYALRGLIGDAPAWSPGLSKLAAGLTIFFGVAALLQATVIPPVLLDGRSALLVLKPNVASGVLVSGLSLALLHRQPFDSVTETISRAAGMLVAVLGVVSVAQDLFGLQIGIDDMLARHVDAGVPARMTVTTGVSFALVGAALFLVDLRPRLAQACTLGAALVALFSLVASLYGVDIQVGVVGHASMRPHVALVFLILCLGTLLARPPQGLVHILVSRSTAGTAARRLLPSFGLVMAGVGWLTLLGVHAGYYDAEFGLVLFGAMSAVCLLVLVAWHAALLLRMDAARGEAEAKIRLSEERFLKVMESAPTAMIMVDRSGRMALANACAARMFGYTSEELAGRPLDVLFGDLDEAANDAAQVSGRSAVESGALAKPAQSRHLGGTRKDGTFIPVQVDLSDIETAAGPRTLLTVADMSSLERTVLDREAYQRELEAALREKTVLLNEVHHRVKNNLQVIASLLFLQARYTPNPEVKAAFEESQARVKAMALIHQLLYESKDFSRVRIAEYLRRLGQLLAGTYGRRGDRIGLKVEADDVFIELTRAIPCGLLVNELVFNSFKYAFPDGRAGEIYIGLRHDPASGLANLLVRDNGIGLPPELDPKTTKSLGLQLVWQLAEQLGATIRVGSGPGASFEMKFHLSGAEGGDEHGSNPGR